MKIKIRGLVFVGFAAAVFAQSAFATITPNATTDPKTVTSKKYVDEKIPGTYAMTYGGTTHEAETTAGAVVLGNGYGEVKFTKLSNSANDVDTTNGQDVVVTGKAVADAMAVTQNLQAEDYTQITDIHATANDPTSAVIGHKVVLDSAKIDTDGTDIQAAGTTNDDNLVTAGAIKNIMDGVIQSTDGDTVVATSKAVYDYAQPRVATTNNSTVYVGRNGTGDVATWDALGTDNYVTTDTTTSGVYKIKLNTNKITANNNSGADITTAGTITAGVDGASADDVTAAQEKLTTAKAVYDFVTSQVTGAGYQPKVADTDHDKLMLGYSAQGGTTGNETYTLGWKELKGAGDSNAGSTVGYVSITTPATGNGAGTVYTANLVNDLITTQGSAISGYNASTATTNGNDLVTVSAIKEYASAILEAANPCTSVETDGHYCALVAKYDATNGVSYEWTVMAPQN